MSKRASPTLVGMFIVGAVALLIVGVLVFGSISFLRARPLAVAYFPGNVFGLRVGAPVNLRGVQVGTVADIDVEIDVQTLTARIPVYMQFEPERVTAGGRYVAPFRGIVRRAATKCGTPAGRVSEFG
jgi:paraquat-inducible protein B